jgi:hypothetical protein
MGRAAGTGIVAAAGAGKSICVVMRLIQTEGNIVNLAARWGLAIAAI